MTGYSWVTQGHYGGETGWEDLTYDETKEDAEQTLREYRENEPQYRHRVVRRWEKQA